MLHPQTKPSLTTSKVWSASNVHEFVPIDATWAGGVVTFTFKNHGLANSDVVTVSCVDTTSAWHMGSKTITLVDKDTFTVPLVSNPGSFPNASPYPSNYLDKQVKISCSTYSRTFYGATYLQIEDLGGATNLKIQAKLNDDAPWVDAQTTLSSITSIIKITDQHNFMRVVVGSGTASTVPVVYTQK